MGCVIAELFLDGKAFMDLGQLLSLKQGCGATGIGDLSAPPLQTTLFPQLGAIPDGEIRDLVQHMVQVDPGWCSRWSRFEWIDP